MCDENSWDAYRRACLNQIRVLSPEDKEDGIARDIALANQEERVFTAEVGGEQNLWKYNASWNLLEPSLPASEGWREKNDGSRERVFYFPMFGWYTLEELARERSLFPRTAP